MSRSPKPIRRQKRFDFAGLLPIVGFLLLVTPLVSSVAFDPASALANGVTYIFCVWAGLIILSYWLSKYLRNDGEQ